MKILVTGGCGFIGSHLVGSLLEEKEHEITILERRSTKVAWDGKVKTIKGDIRKPEDIKKAAQDAGIIFHLAGQISVPGSVKDPETDMEINCIGTLNVLEAARRNDAQVIYASTAAVYGNPEYIPVDEDHPKKPLSPYGISKLAAENCCIMYAKNYGMQTAVARFSNVYGPGSGKAVVHSFISGILKNRSILIEGTGKQKRDMIYVKDAVSGLLVMRKAKPAESYNISTGNGISINQLAEKLKKILGDFRTEHGPAREADITESVLSSEKARKELGFRPRYELEEGLNETAGWIRKQMRK